MKINIKIKIVFFALMLFSAFSPLYAEAQGRWGGDRGGSSGTGGDGYECGDPDLVRDPATGLCLPAETSSENSVNSLIITVINFLLGLAATVAILFIVIGGFQYMFAGANPELAKKGKQTLLNAVIGLAIIILSYVIVSVVNNAIADCFGPFAGMCGS